MMKILYCHCAHTDIVPAEKSDRIRLALAGAREVVAVPDLCALAARGDETLRELANGSLIVIACHERAVRWLFEYAGVAFDPERHRVLSMRDMGAEAVISEAGLTKDGQGEPMAIGKKGEWVPWFPVIDYERCTKCGQCLSFCLFGVYETDADGKIVAANPENCKNNCPACARICPEVAIMFPKLNESPINGAPVTDAALGSGNVQLNREGLASGDLYGKLAQRSAKRKRRLLKNEAEARAVAERKACQCECDKSPGYGCDDKSGKDSKCC